MRFGVAFATSATALLLPAFAVSDPVQNPPANVASATTPAGIQAPGAAPASGAPSPATTAAAQSGPETVVVHGDEVDLNRVVCKQEPAETGSRLGGGRECHTEREWRQRMHDSQDITRRQQILGYHQ